MCIPGSYLHRPAEPVRITHPRERPAHIRAATGQPSAPSPARPHRRAPAPTPPRHPDRTPTHYDSVDPDADNPSQLPTGNAIAWRCCRQPSGLLPGQLIDIQRIHAHRVHPGSYLHRPAEPGRITHPRERPAHIRPRPVSRQRHPPPVHIDMHRHRRRPVIRIEDPPTQRERRPRRRQPVPAPHRQRHLRGDAPAAQRGCCGTARSTSERIHAHGVHPPSGTCDRPAEPVRITRPPGTPGPHQRRPVQPSAPSPARPHRRAPAPTPPRHPDRTPTDSTTASTPTPTTRPAPHRQRRSAWQCSGSPAGCSGQLIDIQRIHAHGVCDPGSYLHRPR